MKNSQTTRDVNGEEEKRTFELVENCPSITVAPVETGASIPFFLADRLIPLQKKTFYANGYPGSSVTVTLERQAFSGGHQHGSAHEAGATGTISPKSAVLGKYPQNYPFIYTAAEACGIVDLAASFTSGHVVRAQFEIMITGLVPIAASDRLRLKETTPEHPSPYWVTPAMNQKLVALADRYFAERHKPITVTDASLVWGGRFDIQADWNAPHAEHRDGQVADIRNSDMTTADKEAFERICSEVELNPDDHTNHWHVRF